MKIGMTLWLLWLHHFVAHKVSDFVIKLKDFCSLFFFRERMGRGSDSFLQGKFYGNGRNTFKVQIQEQFLKSDHKVQKKNKIVTWLCVNYQLPKSTKKKLHKTTKQEQQNNNKHEELRFFKQPL